MEAYRDLDRTIRAAKQLTRCSKTARKQAQRAAELWKVSEHRITVLEQQLQDGQNLGPPDLTILPTLPLYNPPISHSIDTTTQTVSNPVDVCT